MTLQKIIALSGHLSQIGALLVQKSSTKEGFSLVAFPASAHSDIVITTAAGRRIT